ncbi:MAG: rod-binding protein [Spirochaetaceae bacterium]|jgi:flagellar protein FlgJ|nr:rod-binding protein [Spirochaetaceae bacterium]
MDISEVSSYLNTARQVPFSQGILSGSRETAGRPDGTDTVFADILDKFRNVQAAKPGGLVEAEKEPVPALSSGKPVIDKAGKLYEQCEALETFLVKTLISGMRNTISKSNLLDTGFAGQMYEDMLYDEYAKDFTRNANFGLAELAYLELTGQRGKVLAK